MWVYVKTTRDKYKLPICITKTLKEMSDLQGVSTTTIKNMIWRSKQGIDSSYTKIWIDYEDEE